MYFVITLYYVFIYGTSLSFNYIATSFIIKRWFDGIPSKDAISVAGEAMGLPFLIAAILVPIFGYISDKFQNRANLLILASLISLGAYLNFIFYSTSLGLLLLGTSFSLANSIVWAAYILFLKPEALSIAYSLTLSMLNIATSGFPMITTYIHAKEKNFDMTLAVFVVFTLIAFVLSLILLREDKLNGNILNGKEEIKDTLKNYNLKECDKSELHIQAKNHQDRNEEKEKLI